jgi:single-strand DNA-binding protein
VAYQRTAEIIRDYVRKGSRIFIEGKLRTDSWGGDKHSGERRYKKEIVVLEVSLLSSGSSTDHTNAKGEDDGADDFPRYAQYAQGEITRAEVPY